MPAGKNHRVPFKFRIRGKVQTFYAPSKDEARDYARRWARRNNG